jgi:hypothetical protein
MTREQAFLSLAFHPHYADLFKRLDAGDRVLCAVFLMTNEGATTSGFGAAVNRMFLDVEPKPKNKAIVQDLLTAANTIAGSPRVGRPPKFDGAMVRLDSRVPEGLRLFLEQDAASKNRDLAEHCRQIFLDYCASLQKQGEEK